MGNAQGQSMRKYLKALALVIALAASGCVSTSDRQIYDDLQHSALIGEWTGVMSFGSRSLDIQWRFERTNSGQLIGYMGQVDRGGARISMDNLIVTDNELNFTINGEGSYAGQISATEVVGTWTDEGLVQVPLNMNKM